MINKLWEMDDSSNQSLEKQKKYIIISPTKEENINNIESALKDISNYGLHMRNLRRTDPKVDNLIRLNFAAGTSPMVRPTLLRKIRNKNPEISLDYMNIIKNWRDFDGSLDEFLKSYQFQENNGHIVNEFIKFIASPYSVINFKKIGNNIVIPNQEDYTKEKIVNMIKSVMEKGNIKDYKINIVNEDNINENTMKKIDLAKAKLIIKESVQKYLKSIDEAGNQAALEAKIGKIKEEMISRINRLKTAKSMNEMSDLIDEKRVKEIEKEIKTLNKGRLKYEAQLNKMRQGTKILDEEKDSDDE